MVSSDSLTVGSNINQVNGNSALATNQGLRPMTAGNEHGGVSSQVRADALMSRNNQAIGSG